MKTTLPKFSIITPVHLWNDERVNSFLRTIESVKKQTYKNFEWIIVDDGSPLPFLWEKLEEITKIADFPATLAHTPHEERVIAYNTAFQLASGEWFVLLDSDDELKPEALEKMSMYISRTPQMQMFNFGNEYHHKDGNISSRDPFEPKRERVGHEQFGGGNIVNGTFIWHKSIYKELGAFPNSRLENVDTSEINYGGVRDLYMGTPYDFSAAAQLEFPEIREYFMVNHEDEPNKIIKELGNPWGQDYYLFYKYTRKFHSKPIKENLLIVHPR